MTYTIEQIKALRAALSFGNVMNENDIAFMKESPAIVDQLLEDKEIREQTIRNLKTIADSLKADNEAYRTILCPKYLGEIERLKAETACAVDETAKWIANYGEMKLYRQAAEDVAIRWGIKYARFADSAIKEAFDNEIEKRLTELKEKSK